MEQYLKKYFKELLVINSPSGSEDKVRNYIQKELKKIGGYRLKIDNKGNLIATSYKGVGKPSLIISSHMDTVEPTPNLKVLFKNNAFYSDGKTILGADNKASIAEVLTAAKYISKSKIKFINHELIFCVEEEIGMLGSKKLKIKNLKSKKGYAFDYSRPFGYLINKCAGACSFKIKIKGKAVHSSLGGQKLNAINLSSKLLTKKVFSAHTKNYTVNVGIINSGKAVNTTADYAEISGLVRGSELIYIKKALKDIESAVKKISKSAVDARLEIKWDGFPYKISSKSSHYKKTLNLIKQIGLKPNECKSLGLSDANVYNRSGIEVIEMGYGAQNTHSKKEFVKIKDLKNTSLFIIKALTIS